MIQPELIRHSEGPRKIRWGAVWSVLRQHTMEQMEEDNSLTQVHLHHHYYHHHHHHHQIKVAWTVKTIARTTVQGMETQAKQHSEMSAIIRKCRSSGKISYVFSLFLKTGNDNADVKSLGRLFYTLAAATGKAQPPTTDRQTNGISIFQWMQT